VQSFLDYLTRPSMPGGHYQLPPLVGTGPTQWFQQGAEGARDWLLSEPPSWLLENFAFPSLRHLADAFNMGTGLPGAGSAPSAAPWPGAGPSWRRYWGDWQRGMGDAMLEWTERGWRTPPGWER
jgi:hypothetical protein